MTHAEIETELLSLRSDLAWMVTNAKSRENEWRRLSLIAMATSILASVTGAGFMIANVVIERTGSNSNFHDQLVMMGIIFICLGVPLMIVGQALRSPRPN